MSVTHVEPVKRAPASAMGRAEFGVLFVNDMRRETLRELSVRAAACGLSRSRYVRQVIDEHVAGSGESAHP